MLRQIGSRVVTVAASFWVSPLGEELHGLDVKSLSGCDVLTVGQLHCSLDGAGQALVQAGGARRPHQLQARADHIAHNCRVKHTKQEDFYLQANTRSATRLQIG